MVSSITGSQSSSILAGISGQGATPSGSTPSFTDQLAAALEGYLARTGNRSNLEIDIQTTQSQNSGVRQFIVTVKDPDSAPPAPQSGIASPATTLPTAPATSAKTAASTTVSTASSASPDISSKDTSSDSPAAPANGTPMTECDAYWAAQPPAVQKLRDVTDFAERNSLAQNLADQGYTIDKAIMVWGWDPMKTMLTRQMYGYTWAPSLNQGNVSTPGLTVGNQVAYDPKNPPPGSIAVNTDFAKGLGITDPWA